MKERGEFPNVEGNAVREFQAMHEENFWSNWLREDERGKEERTARAEKNEEEKGEKRKREDEKEENETGTLWRLLESSVKGGDLESCGDLSWGDLLEKHEDLSDCKPDSCAHVRVVPDVTDVPVSPSVVTELFEFFSCCSDWEDVVPQSFSFSNKASTLLCMYARRDEV